MTEPPATPQDSPQQPLSVVECQRMARRASLTWPGGDFSSLSQREICIAQYFYSVAPRQPALRSHSEAGPRQSVVSADGDPLSDLVLRFSDALLAKLKDARDKYGYQGEFWREPHWRDDLLLKVREHLEKGDPRDVAAYCAFAWHHGWSLTEPPATPQQDEVAAVLKALRTRGYAMLSRDALAQRAAALIEKQAAAPRTSREAAALLTITCPTVEASDLDKDMWINKALAFIEPIGESAVSAEAETEVADAIQRLMFGTADLSSYDYRQYGILIEQQAERLHTAERERDSVGISLMHTANALHLTLERVEAAETALRDMRADYVVSLASARSLMASDIPLPDRMAAENKARNLSATLDRIDSVLSPVSTAGGEGKQEDSNAR